MNVSEKLVIERAARLKFCIAKQNDMCYNTALR